MLVKNNTSWKKNSFNSFREEITCIYRLFQHVFYFKKILSENQNIYTYMQSNKLRTVYINKWKKNINDDLILKLKKSKDIYKSKYLILQDVTFKRLCLLNLLIKIIFLSNQTIIKINTHIKLIE
jgi:hypothetical protein